MRTLIELQDALHGESPGNPTWRPLRAVMDAELDDQAGRVWMTTEQFQTWMEEQGILRRRRKDPLTPCLAVGIGSTRRRTLLHGRDTPAKAEALAMAHYAARMELPISLESPEAYGDLLMTHFGAYRRISDWLHVDHSAMSDQVRGYRINARRERVPAPIDVTVLRALDWVMRVGPFCPYGAYRVPPTFKRTSEVDEA